MKPTVFLSHAKADRALIERVAADLRVARINVWFDEWEIPPGESFRHQIFEQGIPNSDLFFVYLTSTAATSYWVSRELDAAFVRDAEAKGGYLAIFVDSDATRGALPLDLRGLHSPVLNSDDYERALWQLISRAWEALLRRRVRAVERDGALTIANLQRDVAERDAKLARMEALGTLDIDHVITRLTEQRLSVADDQRTLAQLFRVLAPDIAMGPTVEIFGHAVARLYGYSNWGEMRRETQMTAADFLGPFVIERLVTVQPANGDWMECFYLSDLGKVVAARLA